MKEPYPERKTRKECLDLDLLFLLPTSSVLRCIVIRTRAARPPFIEALYYGVGERRGPLAPARPRRPPPSATVTILRAGTTTCGGGPAPSSVNRPSIEVGARFGRPWDSLQIWTGKKAQEHDFAQHAQCDQSDLSGYVLRDSRYVVRQIVKLTCKFVCKIFQGRNMFLALHF